MKLEKKLCNTQETDFEKLLKLQSNVIGPLKHYSVRKIKANIVQISKEENRNVVQANLLETKYPGFEFLSYSTLSALSN